MQRNADEIELLFTKLTTRYAARNSYITFMKDFFNGKHWSASTSGADGTSATEGSDATQETITVNFARTTVLKYTALMNKGFRLWVPAPAPGGGTDLRNSARRREAFLRSLVPEVTKAYRRAELNANKVGYGVIQCTFLAHSSATDIRKLSDEYLREYTLAPGQSRSMFQFRSIPPEDFFPVFSSYSDPNLDLYYVIRREPNRLLEQVKARYEVELKANGGWNFLDDQWVEPRVELIHYWDAEDYYLAVRTSLQNDVKTPKDWKSTVVLEQSENPWHRPPYWIVPNIQLDELDPTWEGTASDMDAEWALNKRFNEMISEAATEVRVHIHSPMVYSSDDPQQDVNAIEFEPGAVVPIGAEERLEQLKWSPDFTGVNLLLDRYKTLIDHVTFLNPAAYGDLQGRVTGVGVRLAQASTEQMIDLKAPSRVDALTHMFGSVLAYTEQLLQVKEISTASENATPSPASAPEPVTVPSGNGNLPPAAPTVTARPVQSAPSITLGGRMLFRVLDRTKRSFVILDIRASDIAGEYDVMVDFTSTMPADVIQREQNEVFKFKSHVQPLRETLIKLGYDDPETIMQELFTDLQNPILFPDVVQAMAMAKQAQGAGAQPAPSTAAPAQLGPAAASIPAVPRSEAPTVPSNMATPGGANAPQMPRGPAMAGPSGPGNMGTPPGPGINVGANG